jgi:HSP20 family protein
MEIIKRSEGRSTMDRPWANIDRFFDDMWRNAVSRVFKAPFFYEMSDSELLPWHPLADIEETEDAYVLRMDLPGINKNDIHLSIEKNVLTIRGERKHEGSEKNENYHAMERFYGKFQRSFVLPSSVDDNSVNAEYKDGVLTVTLKKKEEAKPKAIEIH